MREQHDMIHLEQFLRHLRFLGEHVEAGGIDGAVLERLDQRRLVKVEAAQYKVSLIQLTQKEVELARLLKWSHEEFLKSTEDFQSRERTYQQAIEAYQKRLAGTGATDDQKTIADLRQALASKTEEASNLAAQLARTGTAPASVGVSSGSAPAAASTPQADQLARLQRLLAAEQKALALKEIYLGWLETHVGAGK